MNVEFQKLAAAGKIRKESILLLEEFRKTGCVIHKSWGFGRVKAFDTVFSRMKVDFPGKPGHTIDLDFAAQILKPATSKDDSHQAPVPVEQLNWKLLPAGELNIETLRKHIQASALRRSKGTLFDLTRLEFMLEFRPVRVFAGLDEFDGYLAFIFSTMSGAVLENPIEGNAVYIFDEHWREMSKLSKSELFQESPGRFRRVVHTGDWKSRLKEIMQKHSK
jgi:hypothetical protein